MKDSLRFIALGAGFGFTAVLFGAFGAHALKARLDAYALGVFQTAVQYHFVHALALLFVGLYARDAATPLVSTAGYAFTFGVVVFSGSLYLLAVTGVKGLGAITPIGGTAFLLGWILLLASVWKAR